MTRFRYGAWRGGGDPLAGPLDVRAAVDDLGASVLAGDGVREALRRVTREGRDGRRGLDELRAHVRRRRDEVRRRGDLAGALRQVRELLDRAVDLEREALAGAEDEDARFREAQLDALPADTARAVAELDPYDWRSPEAAATYAQIRELLQRDVLDQQFQGISQALQDPEATARMRDMLADLNALLAAHARGEDTTEAFEQFMDRHGEFFPGGPRNVDELIDELARRAAAGERLMRSLRPEQREQLGRLMEDAMSDLGMAAEMAALRDNLRSLRPGLDWTSRGRIDGDEPLGYGEATGALEELADLEALEEQLTQDYAGATLDDVDVEALERRLGARAVEDLRQLRGLERELERQGWLTRDADGLRLSPKALRRLGQTALRQVFAQMEARRGGDHDLRDAGAGADPTGSHREWRFGDEQPIDVVRTVSNAVLREAQTRGPGRAAAEPGTAGLTGSAGRAPSGRTGAVRLTVEDFAVAETERRATAAVALLVDLSYSMVHEGRWGPMKQTALALHHLVSTRFRQDALEIIGFNRWARRLSAYELAGIEPEWVQGTNLHHALMMAGRFVRRHPNAEPVVLVVTDGEPTAHMEPDGYAYFDWPPSAETIRHTVAEADALARGGVGINVFMLGDDPGLRRFVDAVARRCGGRVFTPSLDRLGEYVVADYLRARGGRRSRRSA